MLDGNRSLPVREAAAAALLRRIQQHTPALTRGEVETLETLQDGPGDRPETARGGGAGDRRDAAGRPADGRTAQGIRAEAAGPAAAPKEEKPPMPPKEEKP